MHIPSHRNAWEKGEYSSRQDYVTQVSEPSHLPKVPKGPSLNRICLAPLLFKNRQSLYRTGGGGVSETRGRNTLTLSPERTSGCRIVQMEGQRMEEDTFIVFSVLEVLPEAKEKKRKNPQVCIFVHNPLSTCANLFYFLPTESTFPPQSGRSSFPRYPYTHLPLNHPYR